MEESWGHCGRTWGWGGVIGSGPLGTGVPESGSMARTRTLIQCPKMATPGTPTPAKHYLSDAGWSLLASVLTPDEPPRFGPHN
jgi:hypothetical protein